jgi:hypothetical protein
VCARAVRRIEDGKAVRAGYRICAGPDGVIARPKIEDWWRGGHAVGTILLSGRELACQRVLGFFGLLDGRFPDTTQQSRAEGSKDKT